MSEADNVVDGTGHAMPWIVPGELVVDGSVTEIAGCVVGFAE